MTVERALTTADRSMKASACRGAMRLSGWLRGRAYAEYEKKLEEEISKRSLPEHVAIIMDGNRRYARKIGVSVEEGYHYGAGITEHVVEWCFDAGVKQLTLYAFSIENFCRTDEEKEKLFELLRVEFEKLTVDERIHRNEVRVRAIGNLALLPDSVRAAISKAEQVTERYNHFNLFVAVSKHLYVSQVEGEADAADAGAKTSVDLIIRTGGELRISNFVPWQALGNECTAYFCAPFWPEFRRVDLLRAIRTYQERELEKRQRTSARIANLKRLVKEGKEARL
jgi:tritrans,polycis-undecaprenyl-diphosphate synthase [geranylgeranyl-diphosphate specific]